jgi:hypothetical protein
MKNKFEITCPKCKASFNAEEAFQKHFEIEKDKAIKEIEQDVRQKAKEDAGKIYENQLKVLQEENKAKENKITKQNEAIKEAEKRIKLEAEQKIKIAVEQAKNEGIKEAKEKAQKDAEAKVKESIEKYKLDFKKQFEEDEGKKIENKLKEEFESKFKKDATNQNKTIQDLKDQLDKVTKERELDNDRNKKQIAELASLNAKTKSEMKGEVQEELIQDFLRKKFPEDTIEEVKKGARGPDCILTINYQGKKNIGKIFIESKDTKVWNEEWVTKLYNDMQTQGVANGVIVSTSVPKDFDDNSGFVNREGNTITIVRMDYRIIHVTVNLIKSILIMKARNNASNNLPEEVRKVWENVKSPNFQMPVRSMLKQIKEFQKIFDKEYKSFHNNASNRDRILKQLENDLIRMISSFAKTSGEEIFPPDLLEHQEDNLLQ